MGASAREGRDFCGGLGRVLEAGFDAALDGRAGAGFCAGTSAAFRALNFFRASLACFLAFLKALRAFLKSALAA